MRLDSVAADSSIPTRIRANAEAQQAYLGTARAVVHA
jgi:hypothetical protein